MALRQFKLTTLILSVVLGVLAGVLVLFTYLSYSMAHWAVEREVARSFEYRNRIAEVSLQSRLDSINNALRDIGHEVALSQWSFASELLGAETMLDAFARTLVGRQLDILALAKTNGAVAVNQNSPLNPHADLLLGRFLESPSNGEWRLVGVEGPKGFTYALITGVPVENPETGKVFGQIIAGITLNKNASLLSALAQNAGVVALEILVGGEVIAAGRTGNAALDGNERLLSDARESGFSVASQPLVFKSYVKNQFQDELEAAYRRNVLSYVVAALFAAFIAGFLIRRITTVGFGHLVDFAERVGRGKETVSFDPGTITEFNALGAVLEDMVESVRDNEFYLDALLEESASPILIWDESYRVTRINRAAESLFGIDRNHSLGVELTELFADSVWGDDPMDELLDRVVTGIAPIQAFETRFGDEHDAQHVIWDITPIRYRRKGESQTFLAHGTDITDIKRVEEALLQSQEQIRTLLDSTAEAILAIDLEGDITMANPASVSLLGYESEADILGYNSHQLMHHTYPDGRRFPVEECGIYRAFHRGQGSHSEEEVFWRKDGSPFPVEYWSFPILREGEIVGAVVSFLDITQRKRDEAEIRGLRNYLNNIIDSMPSVLVGIDLAGHVTQWNREAERVTGISARDAQHRPLSEVYPVLAEEQDKIDLAIKQKRVQQDQRTIKSATDETRFTDVTIYPLDADGVSGAVIRLDDVTDRVRLEELMIQSEKMASVGGLAAGMAHEINNPLAGILQNTQVIRQRLSEKIPRNQQVAESLGITLQQVRHYLEERKVLAALDSVIESGLRASTIVNNMLSFSRKGASRQEPTDLSALVDKTIELVSNDYDLRKRYDFRHLQIHKDFQEDLPKVPCEPTKIQQVVLNLLKNGAQAMLSHPKRGQTPTFHLRTWHEAGDVCLEVRDNGPGMDEATRKRIYEPFFTTKQVGEGTGLGLAICYFLVTEEHNGRMEVESAPNDGARFIIRLPLNNA